MAVNYPGPCELRLNYRVGINTPLALDHQMRLSFSPQDSPDPGTPFDEVMVVPRVIANRGLDFVVDELVTLLQPFYTAAGTSFLNAELWKYAVFSFDATWISAYDISEVGTGIIAEQLAGQSIFTFRTIEGGIFKVTMMESEHTQGPSVVYSDVDVLFQNLIDYFVEDDESWFLARDTSYPLHFLKLHPGQNERTFKRRYRD